MDVANNISNFINLIMTSIFYSPLIPHALPMALVGTFIYYWTYKYMLLRKHKRPEMLSGTMASFFANLLPWLIFAWSISFYMFQSKFRGAIKFYRDHNEVSPEIEEKLFSKKATLRALIAIAIATLCVILPIRSMLRKCFKSRECPDTSLYTDEAYQFQTNYLKAYPLRVNEGIKHQLEMQLLGAKRMMNEVEIKECEEKLRNLTKCKVNMVESLSDYLSFNIERDTQLRRSKVISQAN